MEKEELSLYDSLVTKAGYNYAKFHEILEISKEYLLRLDPEKRLEMIKEVVKSPNFDDTDIYYLSMGELQVSSSHLKTSSTEAKKPTKIRFKMSERLPTKPSFIEENKTLQKPELVYRKRPLDYNEFGDDENWRPKKRLEKKENEKNGLLLPRKLEEIKMVHKPELVICPKRAHCVWGFGDGEESSWGKKRERVMKKKKKNGLLLPTKQEENKKKKRPREFGYGEEIAKPKKKEVVNMIRNVNGISLPENPPELPEEFKERIKNLGGSKVVFVFQKALYPCDVSYNHGRLSLPPTQIDKGFLSQEDVEFLGGKKNEKNEIPSIKARIIGEGGLEREILLKKWNMPKKSSNAVNYTYNLVTGWNDVVKDWKLKEDMTVQLWSFRVEREICFALAKYRAEGDEVN